MSHSTTRQPLPEPLQRLMSNGYDVASEPGKPFEFVDAAPAGSSSVTGADMQHFMIAHLQDGRYGGAPKIPPDTAPMKHTPPVFKPPGKKRHCLRLFEKT